jgi:hypothetical protein
MDPLWETLRQPSISLGLACGIQPLQKLDVVTYGILPNTGEVESHDHEWRSDVHELWAEEPVSAKERLRWNEVGRQAPPLESTMDP